MAITSAPDAARLVELALVDESTYNTYLNPTSGNGGVQLPVKGRTWGRGHQPVSGDGATGTTQHAIAYRTIRGLDFPSIDFEVGFGPDTYATIFELLTGSNEATNAWAINDYPNSKSVCVNVQRSGTDTAWNFAGCYAESVTLSLPLGAEATASVRMLATSLIDPQSATAMPTLTPTVAAGPWMLKDCTMEQAANTSFAGAAVPIRGATINVTREIITEHTSGSTEPYALVPATIDVAGTIDFNFSTDLWAEATDGFQDVVAKESDGGYTTRFLRFVLTDGSTTNTITLPVRLDMPQFQAGANTGAISCPVAFTAAGDTATPTNPVIALSDA